MMSNKPNGGMPPIYVCSRKESEKENKNREYSSNKMSVSIKDILARRKNTTLQGGGIDLSQRKDYSGQRTK